MPKQKIINYFLVFPNENAVDQWLTANSLRLSSISTIIWHGNTHINGAVRAQYEELAKKVNLPPDKVEYALTYEIPKDENELWKKTGIGAGVGTAAALLFGGPIAWAALGGAAVGMSFNRGKEIELVKKLLVYNSYVAANAYAEYLAVFFEHEERSRSRGGYTPSLGSNTSSTRTGQGSTARRPIGFDTGSVQNDDIEVRMWAVFAEVYEEFCKLAQIPKGPTECVRINAAAYESLVRAVKRWGDLYREISYNIGDSEYLWLAHEIYTQFDCFVKPKEVTSTYISLEKLMFTYIPLLVSVSNLAWVLAGWLDDPQNGHGRTLVKVVPACGCDGEVNLYNIADKEVCPVPFKARTPFFIPAINGEFVMALRRYDDEDWIPIREYDAVGSLDLRALLLIDDEYLLEKIN